MLEKVEISFTNLPIIRSILAFLDRVCVAEIKEEICKKFRALGTNYVS